MDVSPNQLVMCPRAGLIPFSSSMTTPTVPSWVPTCNAEAVPLIKTADPAGRNGPGALRGRDSGVTSIVKGGMESSPRWMRTRSVR
jgi:hypothetical protein